MFAKRREFPVESRTYGTPSVIILGPQSFGFFNSTIAGKKTINMRTGVPKTKSIMTEFRVGTITIF